MFMPSNALVAVFVYGSGVATNVRFRYGRSESGGGRGRAEANKPRRTRTCGYLARRTWARKVSEKWPVAWKCCISTMLWMPGPRSKVPLG